VEPGLVCEPSWGERVVSILVLCSREVRERWIRVKWVWRNTEERKMSKGDVGGLMCRCRDFTRKILVPLVLEYDFFIYLSYTTSTFQFKEWKLCSLSWCQFVILYILLFLFISQVYDLIIDRKELTADNDINK